VTRSRDAVSADQLTRPAQPFARSRARVEDVEESIAPLCREQLGETAAELNDVRRAHDGKVHTVVPIDTRRGREPILHDARAPNPTIELCRNCVR
jgi:hypothetical protein